MPKLFVYGTLKRGQCREAYLRDQTYLGIVRSKPAYQLVDVGAYPGLVKGNTAIKGELYDVSESCLDRLDLVEAVDEQLYARAVIELEPNEFSKVAVTYLYCRPIEDLPDAGDEWTSRSAVSE